MVAEYDASWSLDSTASGFEKMEGRCDARAIGCARSGYLFAHEDAVGGQQMCPEGWGQQTTPAESSTDSADSCQYWWWVDTLPEGHFYARQPRAVRPRRPRHRRRCAAGRECGTEHWPEILRDVADQAEELPRSR